MNKYNGLSYGMALKSMHWLMAFLFFLAIASIELKDVFHSDLVNMDLFWMHEQSGVLLFLLIWLRMYLRVVEKIPPISPPLKLWHKLGANMMHYFLYFMAIAIPLLGIIALQTRGVDVNLFGLSLPVIISEDQGIKYSLALVSYHAQYGDILIYAIILHTLSTFVHHFYLKDNTLLRMLPGW